MIGHLLVILALMLALILLGYVLSLMLEPPWLDDVQRRAKQMPPE